MSLETDFYAILDKADAALTEVDFLRAEVARLKQYEPPPVPNNPTLAAYDAPARPGERKIKIPIEASFAPNKTIVAKWGTSNGTGTNSGTHYRAASGFVIFFPGETRKAIEVELLRDLTAGQTVNVGLGWPQNHPATSITRSAKIIADPTSTMAAPNVIPVLNPIPPKPNYATQLFFQDFADPNFAATDTGKRADGSLCWQSRPGHGRTQPGNRETGYYADPIINPGTKPWEWVDGKFHLRVEHHPEGVKNQAGATIPIDWSATAGNYMYAVGMITTRTLFDKIPDSSYIEFRCRFDKAPSGGYWPAAWLMPHDWSWPPELDMIEAFQKDSTYPTDQISITEHWGTQAAHSMYGVGIPVGQLVPGFDHRQWFTYGYHLETDKVTTYINDVPIHRSPNPTKNGVTWYLLFNTACGGQVPSPAPADLPFRLGLDYVRVTKA